MTAKSGVLASLTRHSVKCVTSCALGPPRAIRRGLCRGRPYALSDAQALKAAGAEPPQKLPNVFNYRAASIYPPVSGQTDMRMR
jgi:hypothetical protein